MKKYLILVVAVFGLVRKIHTLPAELDDHVNRIWSIPQEDGSIRWMTRNEAHTEAMLTEPQSYLTSDKPEKINFYLYTQDNPTEPIEIVLGDLETLSRSSYDFRNPTSFMIHGWKDQYTSGATLVIKNAIFEKNQNRTLNFIAVDWRVYSQSKNYIVSQQKCSKAGKLVAQFIDWMHDNAKLQFNMLTLYGQSLGAQVAGFAGKNVQRGKVHSIIAMDPAMPLFVYRNPKGRLADTDAEYVESIHTNGGFWGFYQPIGQTSFYPNGGKYQPGCGSDSDGFCSHTRAGFYLAEALSSPEKNEFHAVRCDKFDDVKDGKCDQFDFIIQMGDPKNAKKPRGVYYLETNSKSPYSKGTEWWL